MYLITQLTHTQLDKSLGPWGYKLEQLYEQIRAVFFGAKFLL